MKTLLKIVLALGLAASVSACAQTKTFQPNEPVKAQKILFEDGDFAEIGSAEQGAHAQSVWRVTDVQTGLAQTNVTTTDSMNARILPGVLTAATGGLIQAATALTLDHKKAKRCEAGGCGTTPSTVVQIGAPTAVANSASDSLSETNSQVAVNGSGACTGTMANPCPMPGTD